MTHASIRPADVAAAFKKHRLLIVAPIVVTTLVALGYALIRPTYWEASQALIVRDQASEGLRPGKFEHSDEMKNLQETILELAHSRGVLLGALSEVGPRADQPAAGWSDQSALESLQDHLKISPPKGAEFGKTEVFYLKVQDQDPNRAIALATAVCNQLQERMGSLRESAANNAIDELSHSVTLARADLDQSTRELTTLEKSVGNDLAELRILSESPSGDSDLRRNLVDLERELRAFRAIQAENEASLDLLQAARLDPEKILASPAALLRSQPALGRLKDGLVDAQLHSGQALGTMHESHPRVAGAREAERVIRQQLHDEIDVAIKGIEADLRVDAQHVADLNRQIAAANDRLSRLAGVRAEYANITAKVRQRSEALTRVERELAEARASQASAHSISRISAVDKPDVGTRPVSPGRSVIVLAGFAGGLMIAGGLLFLLTPAVAVSTAVRQPAPLARAAEAVKLSQASTAELLTPQTNGHADGHAQGYTNGHASTNGHANGHTNGTTNGRVEPVRTFRQARQPQATAAAPLTLKQALGRVTDQRF